MAEEDYIAAYNNYISDELVVIYPMDQRVEPEVSIVGGTPISTSTAGFTLGGSGYYNGSVAFISSGNGLNSGANVYYGSSTIGTINNLCYYNNSYGDYSITLASSGYTPSSSVFTTGGNVTTYTGFIYNPPEGTYVYKYGSVSGQAYGEIKHIGMSVGASPTVTIKGLTQVELSSGVTANGDSGGPYRIGTNFCGVHHGKSTTLGNNIVYFTPYIYICNAGFNIKIN